MSRSNIETTKENYLNKFKPLQVEVRGSSKEDVEQAIRAFKLIVQKERVISLYKEKSSYEKPSVKRRRKKQESRQKRMAAEAKQKLINSGEWDKRLKRKALKKQRKIEEIS